MCIVSATEAICENLIGYFVPVPYRKGKNEKVNVDLCSFNRYFCRDRDGIWDFSSNKDLGWVAARNLTPTVENGGLTLDITGGDSSIGNYNVDVDPQKVTGFIIKYRAIWLPSNTCG